MSGNSLRPDPGSSEPARTSLPERFFPLHRPGDVDAFVDAWPLAVVFKAGTSNKTFEGWFAAQRLLEPRVDVAVGFVRLPEDRAASDHIAARTGIVHRSPQFILLVDGAAVDFLDEFAIEADRLAPLLVRHLPAAVGPRVRNPAVVSIDPYRRMLAEYVDGTLEDELFQWRYLDRLAKESAWRDDVTFDVLNALFENAAGREVHPARLVAFEFQARLTGARAPLKDRARRVLAALDEI